MPDSIESRSADDTNVSPQSQGSRIAAGFRIVSVMTLLSRVLGMVRDMAMAYAFGAGPVMDAFTVAFRIPNLARRLFGEGALTTAFLPVFVREIESNGTAAARRVTTAVALSLGLTLLGLVIGGEMVLGTLWWVVPEESDGRRLILLTAIMLPYLLLICLAAQFSAVLQSVERFFWPALLPTILNVVWIATVFLVTRSAVMIDQQIQIVAGSVVIAGILQCGVSIWAAQNAGFSFAPAWRQAMPHVREIAQTMGPIVLGLSITQVNVIADSLLAWALAPPSGAATTMSPMFAGVAWPLESGTASALFYSQRMHQFPVGVIGVALGTVLFPLLSRHVERGELDQVGRDQTLGLRLSLAIGVPASVGLMILSKPIAVLLFQRGAFTEDDAILTGQCILAYGLGVWASLAMIVINRGFYALGDRTTPIRYGLWGVISNLVLNLLLIWPLAGAGLAWATSVSAILQSGLLVAAYQRNVGLLNLPHVLETVLRTLLATGLMAAACWGTMHWLPGGDSTLSRAVSVIGPVVVSVVVYLSTARLIRLREPFLLLFRQLDD